MARKLKPGDRVELEIDGLDAKGRGLADLDGLRVAVRRALPGDRVEAQLRRVRRRRGEAEAVLTEIAEPGSDRVAATCAHFGTCGGCLWQDVPYDRQVALKERLVRDALKAARISVELGPSLTAVHAFHYRNKMEFSVGRSSDDLVEIGLHHAGRFNRIFDLEACHLQSEMSNAIVAHVRAFANRHRLAPYDLRRHEGLLRFLTVREGKGTGEAMVILTTSDEPFPGATALAEELREAFPALTVVVHAINRRLAQVATGDELVTHSESGAMQERVGPYRFAVSPESFFQPNTAQAERMFRRVVELARPESGDRVLDLYCGTGAIAFHLAPHVREVLGIEVVEAAVEDARRNAELNDISNCRFVAGPSEDLLDGLREEGRHYDVAVTDPPRAGMHARALAALCRLGPRRIVYVSCNPVALGRDLALFGAQGYRTLSAELVDMLPHTPHCEVLAVLVSEEA